MYNELLKIGPFTVYGYGLMIAIGILCGYILAEYRAKKKGMPYEEILNLVLLCAAGGLLFAKLLYWITQWRQIAADPGFLMETMGSGFTVYGGVLGGILLGFLYCRKRGLKFLQFFDLIMPSVALAQGFGRIGCFLAGCCYGKESTSGWTVTFQHSEMAPNGVPLIPTQIYSSLFDFALALLLIYLAERIRRDGVIAGLYLCFYSAGRFIIEFFRGDMERGQIGILSTSQFLAVFSLAAGVLLLVALCGKTKKETV